MTKPYRLIERYHDLERAGQEQVEILRKLREDHGWTLQTIGDELGITRMAVSQRLRYVKTSLTKPQPRIRMTDKNKTRKAAKK